MQLESKSRSLFGHVNGFALLASIWASIGVSFTFADQTPNHSDDSFQRVAQIIASRCLECHSSTDPSGGLDLSTRSGWLSGGESGETAPDESVLEGTFWQWIADDSMPKNKTPLSKLEKDQIKDWLSSGAPWSEDRIDPRNYAILGRAGFDWWSLRPLSRPELPKSPHTGNAIDQFIRQKLSDSGMEPIGRAGERELLRRLSFDLVGLPPTSQDIFQLSEAAKTEEEFTKQYRATVERLLGSPHFGERWARHWLDVVRYGETQGFERNRIRENAWQYRDWVVRAFNSDLPYDDFVRMQIAGDVLRPNDFDAAMATGYHVCGTWDQVGHMEGSAAMQAVARADHLEDLVGSFGQSFLGLTLQCARCHDHKYDPITQREYYQFAALLGGIHQREQEHRGVKFVMDPVRHSELNDQLDSASKELDAIRTSLLGKYKDGIDGNPDDSSLLLGYSFTSTTGEIPKVTPLGQLRNVENLTLAPLADGSWTSVGGASELVEKLKNANGFALEIWFQAEKATQNGPARIVTISNGTSERNLTLGQNGNQLDLRLRTSNSDRNGLPGLSTTTATIDLDQHHVIVNCYATGRLEIWLDAVLVAEKETDTNLASWNNSFRIAVGNEIGGARRWEGAVKAIGFHARPLDQEAVAKHHKLGAESIVDSFFTIASSLITDLERQSLQKAEKRVRKLRGELNQTFYQGDAHTPYYQEVGPTYVLRRGDVSQPTEEVSPKGLDAFEAVGLPAHLELDSSAGESDRRIALAKWTTDPRNPLTPRVIVNRLWHYHFGRGIVDTPSDFGFSGGMPSHPELLDWLATELVTPTVEAFPGEPLIPWSLKHIHRLILYSDTYQQATRGEKMAALLKADPDNKLLARYPMRRLDGESIRDAALSVSGLLDTTLGGPSYRDVVVQEKNNTEFTTPFEPEFDKKQRRTLYRLWARSGNHPLLSVLDCPEPSVATPRRMETLTPLQAIASLHNDLFLQCSRNLASSLIEKHSASLERQVEGAFQSILQRDPDTEERKTSKEFAEIHGLDNLCHVLLNTNEFIYLD